MTTNPHNCLVCNQDSQQVPLFRIDFREKELWICPQHLPILIHNPAKLVDVLPGAETLTPSGRHDH